MCIRDRDGIADEVQRVGAARVLRSFVAVEIQDARLRIERDVLEYGAESLRGGVDLRFCLGGQPNHLRIAAALEVEHTVGAPPVLVVANELSMDVARERRLT